MDTKTGVETYLMIYKNYKSLCSNLISDINYYKDSWGDEFSIEEVVRLFNRLIKEFKDVDFTNIFTKEQLIELGFKWFDDDLLCMPSWVISCLKKGTEVYSISGDKIIFDSIYSLDKDTRFGVTAYGFNRSQIREGVIKNILDENC